MDGKEIGETLKSQEKAFFFPQRLAKFQM